jgi:hypothetical protein
MTEKTPRSKDRVVHGLSHVHFGETRVNQTYNLLLMIVFLASTNWSIIFHFGGFVWTYMKMIEVFGFRSCPVSLSELRFFYKPIFLLLDWNHLIMEYRTPLTNIVSNNLLRILYLTTTNTFWARCGDICRVQALAQPDQSSRRGRTEYLGWFLLWLTPHFLLNIPNYQPSSSCFWAN